MKQQYSFLMESSSIKHIDFPKEEISTLSKQDYFITTRVSDDYNKYFVNDIVITPWNKRYKIVKRINITNIKDHSYYKELTKDQIKFLSKFNKICILRAVIVDLYSKCWNFVINRYKSMFDINLSYMKYVLDDKPHYNNGKVCTELKPEESGGSWTKKSIVYINNDMKSVMDYYHIKNESIEHFTKIIMAHELAHEVFNNVVDDKFKEKIVNEAKNKKFHTVYLDYVRSNKLYEETFCEYMANLIVNKK